jgi:hypothetical protein
MGDEEHVGTLHYDGREYELDDRTLAHLQIVISTKLRRRECFFLTWVQAPERGSGRHTIWVDNGVPLHMFYGGSRLPAINREWIDALLVAAGKTAGLQLMDEPDSRSSAS